MNSTKIVNTNRKIMVLQYYFIFKDDGLKNIALDLGIAYNTLIKIVAEYKKNDCIIVKSKFS